MKKPPLSAQQRFVLAGLTGIAAAAALVACGGGGDAAPAPAPGPAPATPTRIQGVVATGAAVPGATITVKDSSAATADVTGTANASGAYTIDVSSQVAPLLVSAAGTLNGETVTIVAVVPALAGNADNTANVTSLTQAVAGLIAPGGDLNALAVSTALAAVNTTTAANASALVVNTLRSNPAFASLIAADYNPLSTAFVANNTGVDSVLDQIEVAVSASGVAITNLSAPVGAGGQPAPATLTPGQVSNPTQPPALPASTPAADLPTTAEMVALAKKYTDCLALPIAQRVTLDANNEVTAVSAACNFVPTTWRSDGGNFMARVGMGALRHPALTGATAGTPTIALVVAPPNFSGTTFQHPVCNTATCVDMRIPMVSASGKPFQSSWLLGKLNGQWDFVGNQRPYAMGVEHRLSRKIAVNTALAASAPTNYFAQDRMESVIRVTFNPDGSDADTSNVRAVVWKGPGLPAAGLVTHRSQRCGTDDRFPITNQEGILTVNNTANTTQWWNNGSGIDFIVDAARLDGTALAMPTPSGNWATNSAPSAQDIRSAPLAEAIAAYAEYRAEIYLYSNTGNTTPDQVVILRSGTPYERAAVGASRNWPTLAQAAIDQYLTPTGSGAGSISSLAQTVNWTNPSDSYVNFTYLFSQNRVSATNTESETANYWKRSNLFFRVDAYGDSSAPGFEWAPNRAGTSLSPTTASNGSNPNPRCGADEVLPLDATSVNNSYREIGLQTRGADRKVYQLINFWTN